MRRSTSSLSESDLWSSLVLPVLAGVGGAVVLLIALFLATESWPFLSVVGPGRIFSDPRWSPMQGFYSLMPMLLASAGVAAGALLLAAPLGIGAAVFGRFHLPDGPASLFNALLVTMAGIPSVVFGLWGLDEVVPLIAAGHPPGTSLVAGILILAVMILPTVALTTSTALSAVPSCELQAAAALGMSTSGTILGVALPSARRGIRAGIVLAMGRALGETVAVLMVCGNVVQIPTSVWDPVRPLTANIALEIAYASGTHRAALFASGLLLTGFVAVLALGAARVARSTT
ncbi:MAG: PstC family ABC transporter permease [Candidatus Binatia bacterium]